MRSPKLTDYILLIVLALIWSSAFFNIKIATYSFGPVTIAFLRIFLELYPLLHFVYTKNKNWSIFKRLAMVCFNWHGKLSYSFFLIAYGVQKVQSNLAAILMASTPLSATVLAHFFTSNEKINLTKTFGVLLGFSGIVFLFSDNILINENNFFLP